MLTEKHWWANIPTLRNLQAKYSGAKQCDRCKLFKPDVNQIIPLWLNLQACCQCIDEINAKLQQSPVLDIIKIDHPLPPQ